MYEVELTSEGVGAFGMGGLTSLEVAERYFRELLEDVEPGDVLVLRLWPAGDEEPHVLRSAWHDGVQVQQRVGAVC